jgi:hypothetical protein
MSKYDPRSNESRRLLTEELLALFERALFTEVFIPGTKERLFARDVPDTDGKIRVLVYSTIENGMARACGKDAIRVCALYRSRDGRERGIASGERRVNRTGTVEAICERVISRMRDCWKATKTASKCHCGAPQFRSKAKNLVCCDLCWKSEAEMRTSYRASTSRVRRSNYGRPARSHAYSMNRTTGTANIDFDFDEDNSWADAPLGKQVARSMAQGDNSGFDWDRWADERKEGI